MFIHDRVRQFVERVRCNVNPNIMSYDTFGSFIITLCLEVGRCRVSFSLNFKTAEYDRIPLQASRLQTRLRA